MSNSAPTKVPSLLTRSLSCEFTSLFAPASSGLGEKNLLFPSLDLSSHPTWDDDEVGSACSSARTSDDTAITYHPLPSDLMHHSASKGGILVPPPLNLNLLLNPLPPAKSNSARRSNSITEKSPKSARRDRSCSLPDVSVMDCFVQLDSHWPMPPFPYEDVDPMIYLEHSNMLSVLISKVDTGMKCGIDPTLADGALGGTYFLRDTQRIPCIVCKPGDEEPNGPWNPHSSKAKWASYKGRIIPGFGMYREVATYLLNGAFVGIPPTALARVRHKLFRSNSILRFKPAPTNHSPLIAVFSGTEIIATTSSSVGDKVTSLSDISEYSDGSCNALQSSTLMPKRGVSVDSYESGSTSLLDRLSSDVSNAGLSPQSATCTLSYRSYSSVDDVWESNFSHKPCSVQAFVKHICSAEDMGSSRFSTEDIQRIAMMDIRMCNLDRHEGNFLVANSNPYSILKDTIDSAGKHRLIPIDHGYCLPHVLCMNGASLSWLYWSQISEPVLPSIVHYVSQIDVNADIANLKRCIGVAMPEPSLLTLRVCSTFLKKGIAAGLTLFDLGNAMSESFDGTDEFVEELDPKYCEIQSTSKLLRAVVSAINASYQQGTTFAPSAPNPINPSPLSSTPIPSKSPPKSPGLCSYHSPSTTVRKSLSSDSHQQMLLQGGTANSPPPASPNSSVPKSDAVDGSMAGKHGTLMHTPSGTAHSFLFAAVGNATSSDATIEMKLTAAIGFQNGKVLLKELEKALDTLVADIMASKK